MKKNDPPGVDFHFVTGVGIATGHQTDPEVEISWSDDGGLRVETGRLLLIWINRLWQKHP